MKSIESIARAGYEAFEAALPRVAGFVIYSWAELPPEVSQAWLAAARKMAEEIQQVH